MLKRLLFVMTLFCPIAICAQSNWELPSVATDEASEKVEKVSKEEKKAAKEEERNAKEAKKNEQKAAKEKAASAKASVIKEEDRPYLAGAVPEVDGKIVFSADIKTHDLSAEEAYDRAYQYMEGLAKEKVQTDKSKVALINKNDHSIAGTYTEMLTLAKKFYELDTTEFSYVIVTTCSDSDVHVQIERLNYNYTTQKEATRMTAEDTISDEVMLTDNGTKLRKYNARFRRATVDRMQDILNGFRLALQ